MNLSLSMLDKSYSVGNDNLTLALRKVFLLLHLEMQQNQIFISVTHHL